MQDHILECCTYSTTSFYMKRILIFGNSGGIGAAIQKMCIAKGHSVSGLSRSQDGLDLSDENKIVSLDNIDDVEKNIYTSYPI